MKFLCCFLVYKSPVQKKSSSNIMRHFLREILCKKLSDFHISIEHLFNNIILSKKAVKSECNKISPWKCLFQNLMPIFFFFFLHQTLPFINKFRSPTFTACLRHFCQASPLMHLAVFQNKRNLNKVLLTWYFTAKNNCGHFLSNLVN